MINFKLTEEHETPTFGEYELPDPILTEGVDYHDRPDWKKELNNAWRRIKEQCDLLQAKRPDDPTMWKTCYTNMTKDVCFPREHPCNVLDLEGADRVEVKGSKMRMERVERTAETKYFVYKHYSIDFHFGHEWKLNCKIPIFVESYESLRDTATLLDGRTVRTDRDIVKWFTEQIPIPSPTTRTLEVLNGILNGKWTLWVDAVRNVCIRLERDPLATGHKAEPLWEKMDDKLFRYLMYTCFELHRYIFPIEVYDSKVHKALRQLMKAMRLVKGVKLVGPTVFIEKLFDNDPRIVKHGSGSPTMWTWGTDVGKYDRPIIQTFMKRREAAGKKAPNAVIHDYTEEDGKRTKFRKYVYFDRKTGSLETYFITDIEGRFVESLLPEVPNDK